jgi:hypothetical protein
VRLEAVGLLTGWGEGVAALPLDARLAAAGRAVIPLPPPALDGERFRRATRECLLGIAAVHAVLREAHREPEAIRGAGTALIFVTAAAYGASNVEFAGADAARPAPGQGGPAPDRRGSAGSLRFPYTAPPALPAEVAIEFGLTGCYVILIGGAPATVDALWQAGRMVTAGRCQRALVLAVETFAESEALWRRARWTLPGPLVESAACALLVPGGTVPHYQAAGAAEGQERAVETRAGSTLACAPLVAAALAREAGGEAVRLSGTWRGRTAAIELATTGEPCNPRKCSTS